MAGIKNILVAIQHPQESRQMGLKRAAELAERFGARLTLLHVVFNPYAVGPNFYESTIEEGIERTLTDHRSELRKLAEPLRKRGIKVNVQAIWDYPAYEGVVREVMRSKPDLVVAESHRHRMGARLFLSNTDWQLIRACPAPLLFVKSDKPYGKIRVLAAVDPMHGHDKPARLDKRILEAGQALAEAHNGSLDVVHAFWPLSMFVGGAFGDPIMVPVDPKIEQAQEKRMRKALDRLVAPFEIPASRVRADIGTPEAVIDLQARKLKANLVIMGAVSRRGLERVFIGNTAERAMDKLDCDVLTIKPVGFKSPVARTTHATKLVMPPV